MLRRLPPIVDPRVVAGPGGFEDAGAILVSDSLAIVQSVDFFPPPVDDPYDFGRIAAANALSDLYAMGAEPLCALAIAAFPRELAADIVAAVFRGGIDVCELAGAAVIGGHTIVDAEPKYGLAVTGTAHPHRLWRNDGGQAGDQLVLTKPLGTGVIANALRADAVAPVVLAAAVESMTTLNRDAAERLRPAAPHAVTDVSGFGLVGHAHELALNAGLAVEIDLGALPILPGALVLAAAGHLPGGSRRNLAAAEAYLERSATHDPLLLQLACDAQTSGGLLAAVPAGHRSGVGTVVGRLVAGSSGHVLVR